MTLYGNEWPDFWSHAKLTHDMCGTRWKNWDRILEPFRDRMRSVLEVGSYEGQSALYWLNFFPGAKVTCIDTWGHYATGAISADEVEENFDANVGGRVNKIKAYSTPTLYGLKGAWFNLIYIDGDHGRDQVMIDSLLAWRLLRPGGIMIWDDYETYAPQDPPRRRPEAAVKSFITMKLDELTILEDTKDQMFVQKAV